MLQADEKFTAIRTVVEILKGNEALGNMGVSESIFPIVAPDGTEGDYLVYQRDGYERMESKTGIVMQRSVFYIKAVSSEYDRALSLAETVCRALDGEHPEEALRIKLENYSEEYVDKKFFQVLKFLIL